MVFSWGSVCRPGNTSCTFTTLVTLSRGMPKIVDTFSGSIYHENWARRSDRPILSSSVSPGLLRSTSYPGIAAGAAARCHLPGDRKLKLVLDPSKSSMNDNPLASSGCSRALFDSCTHRVCLRNTRLQFGPLSAE